MLPCTSSDTPAISQGSAIALRSLSATASAAALVGRALAQHAELVAAEPGDELALADDVVEPGRDDRQELVPPVMAERVVDLLEPLEIDEEDGQSLLLAILGLERLVEPLAELRPVGKPGQVVVQGLVGDGVELAIHPARDAPHDRKEAEPQRQEHALENDGNGDGRATRSCCDRAVVLVHDEYADRAVLEAERRIGPEHLGRRALHLRRDELAGDRPAESLAESLPRERLRPCAGPFRRVDESSVGSRDRRCGSSVVEHARRENVIELLAARVGDRSCEIGRAQPVHDGLRGDARVQRRRLLGPTSLEVADEDEQRRRADSKGERREQRHAEDEARGALTETGGAPRPSLLRAAHESFLPLE